MILEGVQGRRCPWRDPKYPRSPPPPKRPKKGLFYPLKGGPREGTFPRGGVRERPKSRQNRIFPTRSGYRFRESEPIYLIIKIPATRSRVISGGFWGGKTGVLGCFGGSVGTPKTGVLPPLHTTCTGYTYARGPLLRPCGLVPLTLAPKNRVFFDVPGGYSGLQA